MIFLRLVTCGKSSHLREQANRDAKRKLVAIQEEIDFLVYAMYGIASELTSEAIKGLSPGERPFEILLSENIDGFSVPNGIPSDLSEMAREVFALREQAISSNKKLANIGIT